MKHIFVRLKNFYKTLSDGLQDIFNVKLGNILVSLLAICMSFFFFTQINCCKKALKQHYEVDLSNVKNEYCICFYKQLYEANLSI